MTIGSSHNLAGSEAFFRAYSFVNRYFGHFITAIGGRGGQKKKIDGQTGIEVFWFVHK